ncbi:hypothetical protein Dimus_010002 [Dionaea muscipula]
MKPNQEKNKDFAGELSVTLVDAHSLSYIMLEIHEYANAFIVVSQVDLGSLKDTVPTDRIIVLKGGWGLFRQGNTGEVLLRLTYKAYVEDEEDDLTEAVGSARADVSDDDDEGFDSDEAAPIHEWIQIKGLLERDRQRIIYGRPCCFTCE